MSIKNNYSKSDLHKAKAQKKVSPSKIKTTSSLTIKQSSRKPSSKMVEMLDEEIKFIKRFVSFHNKVKTFSSILSFIKSLQKAIVQKLIRKSSPFASDISNIQDKLVRLYNSANNKTEIRIAINDTDLTRYTSILQREKVYKSVAVIKRFIGTQGKYMEQNKIDNFLKFIERSNISDKDPFVTKVHSIVSLLKKNKTGTIKISKQELDGLIGIVKKCNCHSLGKIYDTQSKKIRRCRSKKYSDAGRGACSYNKGIEPDNNSRTLGKIYDVKQKELRQCQSLKYSDAKRGACSYNKGLKEEKKKELNGIMTAEQIGGMSFERLKLSSKWAKLIGYPALNFDMMLFGQPNSGKTTFLLSFAHYLALNHGDVLYVSREEYGSAPLTDKVNNLPSRPQNLHFYGSLDNIDISNYKFIILDSITDLKISLEDYKELREKYPDTAFILILQTTKDGKFKGGKEWEHEVEIAGNVDNGVISIYKNRYGVKGSMDFFNS